MGSKRSYCLATASQYQTGPKSMCANTSLTTCDNQVHVSLIVAPPSHSARRASKWAPRTTTRLTWTASGWR